MFLELELNQTLLGLRVPFCEVGRSFLVQITRPKLQIADFLTRECPNPSYPLSLVPSTSPNLGGNWKDTRNPRSPSGCTHGKTESPERQSDPRSCSNGPVSICQCSRNPFFLPSQCLLPREHCFWVEIWRAQVGRSQLILAGRQGPEMQASARSTPGPSVLSQTCLTPLVFLHEAPQTLFPSPLPKFSIYPKGGSVFKILFNVKNT